MRAIQSVAVGKAEIVDVQEPELKPDSILVRPHYIGNNPCDWLVVDVEPMFTQNQMIGCDYCGVVEKIGSDVNTDLKLGDKVCGVVAGGAGCDATRGCFGDLFPAYGDFVFRLPNGVTEPQAATLGVGISTVAVAFYEHMKLPLPDEDPSIGQGKPFFVYGGSSAMGLFGIQFAKASGFRVITTCSPKNFDLVKSYGADEAYDYHDIEKCTEEIQKSVGDDLYYAYICAMDANSPKLCAEIFSSKGGMYVTIVQGQCPRSDVQSTMTYGQSVMADPYKAAGADPFKAAVASLNRTSQAQALGQRVWKMALKYLEEGRLKTPPIEIRKGLDGALQGMDDLRKGLVSGRKIISQLA